MGECHNAGAIVAIYRRLFAVCKNLLSFSLLDFAYKTHSYSLPVVRPPKGKGRQISGKIIALGKTMFFLDCLPGFWEIGVVTRQSFNSQPRPLKGGFCICGVLISPQNG